ncbi:MAG TPA: ATP-grasp domain-containing protein [Candidatus Saccharimonadales bacterium]
MQRILIVGERFSTMLDYLNEHGYDYIVLKDIRRTKFPHKQFKKRVVCDFSSKETILKTVDAIKKPIDGVIATYENYILPAAWIAEHLELPGLPIKTAEACTDKFLMRQLFATAPEPISPDFAIINDEPDVRSFAKNHSFPLIIKPTNLAKSLLVSKNHNLEELLKNYHETMAQLQPVYDKYAPHRTPQLIVEEFLEGSIHSVDAFIDKNGEPQVLEHVVDYQTGYDIGFEDNFHYSRVLPSKLSLEDRDALRHVAHLGAEALGMKNTPAHIEIIMTKQGPRIVEIGARNGGYRERMHKLANGIDITQAAVSLCLGEPIDVVGTKDEPCAVLELFPKEPGIFNGIANETALQALPSLHYFSLKASLETFVGKASGGYKMCAVIILHHPDQAQFDKDLAFVNQHVAVKTLPR